MGICRLTLLAPDSHSLKEKRMVLRRIKDKTRLKFNVAIAEVGDQDVWQQMSLGFAVVANERGFVEQMVEKIVGYIDSLAVAKLVSDEKDIIHYGDGEMMTADYDHWEPDK